MKKEGILSGWEKLINENLPKLKAISGDADWVFEFLGWKKHGKRTRRNR